MMGNAAKKQPWKALKKALPLMWRTHTGYQRKLVISYLCISTVLFFLFSLLVLRAASSRYQNDLCSMGSHIVDQSKLICDEVLLNTYRYGLQSISDPTVANLMYQEDYSVSDALASRQLLSDMQKNNAFIQNIYIFNFENESVLTSNYGRMTLEIFFDQDLLEYVQQLPVTSVPVCYVPRMATIRTTAGTTENQQVWTLIFHTSYKGAFVLDISYDEFSSLINIQSGSDYLHNFIINRYQQVLISHDSALFGSDFSDSPLLKAVRAKAENAGNFPYTDPDTHTKFTVYYVQNSYLGLTYISAVEDIALGLDNSTILTILSLSILFLLVSLVLSPMLAAFFYRPIWELNDQMGLPELTEGSDEFNQIRQAYQTMQQKNDELRSSVVNLQQSEEQRMLIKLIDPPAVSQKFTDEQYQPIYNFFSERLYAVLLFNIDTEDIRAEDISLIKFSIENMIKELGENSCNLKVLDYSRHQVAVILNFLEENQEGLRSALSTVQGMVYRIFHATLSIAVGCTVDDTDDLPQSLQQAQNAISRRFIVGSGQITFCSQAPTVEQQDAAYPKQLETQLLQAVRNGSLEDTKLQMNAFFETIYPLRPEMVLLCLIQLDMAIQKLEAANHSDLHPMDPAEFYHGSGGLTTIYKQFEERLIHVLEIVEEVQSCKDSTTEKLIQRVNQLVADNLYSADLTVASIAASVNLSVNYLRNIYKEATGESLSNYITKAKLDMICQLLLTSELSIQEISEKLGFTTRNYFFTFFKKHMGMTPRQYRLMNGNTKE